MKFMEEFPTGVINLKLSLEQELDLQVSHQNVTLLSEVWYHTNTIKKCNHCV